MEERKDDAIVRVMTRQEKIEYDDITIEDCGFDDAAAGGRQSESGRPESFDEVYEDTGRREGDFRHSFRSYGGSGPRVYSFGFGQGMTAWQKWKYRLIGAVVAAAIIWFLIFVALPVVAVGVIVAMIAYMLYSFFS
ncbi:hypothetical protein [Anaerovibrio sp.]|uniref:hypothetical protein n=1 Tax=Anaerovibrio sp. TaxID=1872532 RepID=UPI003F155E83